MRQIIISLSCLLFLVSLPVAAEVYKRTLPDGSVEFTDRPPSQDAQPLQLSPINTVPAHKPRPGNGNVNGPSNNPGTQSGSTDTGNDAVTQYDTLRITQPAPESTIRDNTGSLTVVVSVAPSLGKGHQIRVTLDGQTSQLTSGTSAGFSNISRGTHSVQAEVIDASGNPLTRSTPVSFQMRRISQLGNPAGAPKVPTAPMAPMAPRAPTAN